ncbi:hypothetical protein AB1Y20_016815 [Prymnesium parvum]|uniref:PDZ domain-containing protein n=1 Tax=Prymnesium parvum TaxID=97485 RepID=A0AB34ICC3_PRYPA|mmetsp:Transcript_22576/g.47813  ORF Transcript_22576/g.47813 Transcript_22576/m.47813 type:complete len:926 (-) Transcript_22576:628-3405(-)
MFFKPEQARSTVTVTIHGCLPANGGVGVDLNTSNVILELRDNTAAAIAFAKDASNALRPGDRVLSVDGEPLGGRILTDVIVPAETHTFEVERAVDWHGFSIDETDVAEKDEEDGLGAVNHLREVVVQKSDGSVGILPEVTIDGATGQGCVMIAKVYPGTQASACGEVSKGDVIRSINGQLLAASKDEEPLKRAMDLLSGIADGVDIKMELESDMLMAGFMQKRGEKGMFKTWAKRWFTLVWSETNLAERELRYFESRDYATRKQKGAIDLSQASEVKAVEIDGQRGITIQTPGRLWELLPASGDEAAEWLRILSMVMARKRGMAVVASFSNMAVSQLEPDEQKEFELTVVLTRKLGMAINKICNEITIVDLEPDGAAAACGLLSVGDSLEEVNGVKAETCKQTIQLLLKDPAQAQLKLYSRVIHGGWMHKLGEGLGGWTTRYFTLSYELDTGVTKNEKRLSTADQKKFRQRATSSAAAQELTSVHTVRMCKTKKYDKIGVWVSPADEDGRVRITRIHDGYIASTTGALQVGDVLLEVNGQRITTQNNATHLLGEAEGVVEVKLERSHDRGCYVIRYYDGKNAVSRTEKGVIRLHKDSVREINKYTLSDDNADGDVPRVGLYILQEERCWELLPPEDELDAWISKLQLAIFGQEVISTELCTPEGAIECEPRVRELKGAHYLKLQQQYGLMLATYKEIPTYAELPPPPDSTEDNRVYIMSLEMDGAGACSGMLKPDDRIISVDGIEVESLQQVTSVFRGSSAMVKVVVASRVVFAGFMLKKGELNSEFQKRWFMLSDEADGSVLRYYDGRNAVTRKLKGEIKISPEEILSTRHWTHKRDGEKLLGVALYTQSRTWELLCPTENEARSWLQLLTMRSRKEAQSPFGAPGTGRRSMPDKQGGAAEEQILNRPRAVSALAGGSHMTTRL